MLLAIDIGNTNIVVGVYDRDRLVESGRMSTTPERTIDEYAILLAGLLERLQVPPASVTQILIVSVVPKATAFVKAALKEICRPKPLVVGEDRPIPMKNLYKDPRQVGNDRLVNAVAAREKYGAPVFVVDFGTAITVDVVSGKGAYLGGVIAPGLEISLDALANRAALLPRVELEDPKAVLGRDTVTSMQSGIAYGYGALCDGLVRKLQKAARIKKALVIATGGHAPFIARYCQTVDKVDPTLTLDGLFLL
ncbi:MAG: type III pantothenate kinase, partial [Candidatus Omnitrophica bacterium]|nr:type III pantothenate kinase [Candidatus Omnitrophota bacterium]